MKQIRLILCTVSLFFTLPAFADTCKLPPGTLIQVLGELHNTTADQDSWQKMFDAANADEARVFMEGIPGEANSNPSLMAGYLTLGSNDPHIH